MQHMIDFAAGIRPVFDISYHSYSELVIYPYGCSPEVTPEHELVAGIGQTMAGLIERDNGSMGYSPGTSWQLLYDTDGGDIDWYYRDLGTFAYVIELNSDNQGFLPPYSWRDGTVERNRPAWQYLLSRMDGPAVSGHVRDACNPDTVIAGAVIEIQELSLTSVETPRTSDDNGSFFRLTGSGEYHLEVSAAGYETTVIPVNVETDRVIQDVYMIPVGEYGLQFAGAVIHDDSGDSDAVMDPGETINLELALSSVGMTTGVSAELISSSPYISISDSTADVGTVPDGMIGTTQWPHFTVTADPGCPEQELIEFTVLLTADQDICGDTMNFSLVVSSYVYQCPIVEETMDVNPDWEITNSGSGGWEFGQPSGTPNGAHSGAECYGTNLDGDYGNNGNFRLTSAPFDCSNIANTELHYWRYLDNEAGYDTAYVKVSNNGTDFETVWSGYSYDNNWNEQVVAIGHIADGEPQVWIQWQLTSDVYVRERGFYIDDVSICGETASENPPTPEPTFTATPTPPPSATPTPVVTYTPFPTNTPFPTFTPSPTSPAPTHTNTPVPTDTPPNTLTPTPTIMPPTDTPIPTLTPEPPHRYADA